MVSSLILALSLLATPDTGRWPAFQGAGHTPLTPAAVPQTWNETEHVAWKTTTPGHGQSSPVIWGDHVYLTSVAGPNKETYHLVCLNLADGKELWQKSVTSTDPVKNSVYVSRAAPTPVVDDTGVYAFFESGDYAAWNHAGELLWQRSLSADYGKFQNEFGLAASPVLYQDRLIQLIDHDGPSYILALDKATGKTVWKSDRTGRRSWTSPVLVSKSGRDVIVVSSDGSVDGYDPQSGQQLFNFTDVGGNTGTTPCIFGEGRFLIGASAGQRGENAEMAKKSNMAMELLIEGDTVRPAVLWRNTEVATTFSSPMVHAGYAYWINRSGIVSCLDIATGELKYTQRTPQSAWATPVGIGDRVYFFGKDGITTVIAAGPEFQILSENPLWNPETAPKDETLISQETEPQRQRSAAMFASPVQYGVAIVNGSLLIRSGTVLFCVR